VIAKGVQNLMAVSTVCNVRYQAGLFWYRAVASLRLNDAGGAKDENCHPKANADLTKKRSALI
jgi:hypothetical protein